MITFKTIYRFKDGQPDALADITGEPVFIKIGDRRVRFAITPCPRCVSKLALTHVKSGMLFGVLAPKSAHYQTNRSRAVDLVEFKIAAHGVERVLSILDNAKSIN